MDLKSLSPEAKEMLANSATKDINEITPSDIEILFARRDYLTGDQQKKFAKVLKNRENNPPEPEVEEPVRSAKEAEIEIFYPELMKRIEALGLDYIGFGKVAIERAVIAEEKKLEAKQKKGKKKK